MAPFHSSQYWLSLEGRVDDFEIESKIAKVKAGLEGEAIFQKQLPVHPRIPYLQNFYFNPYHPLEIDFLIINRNQLLLFEIKHFIGDYTFEGGDLRSSSDFRIPNPLSQLTKQSNALRQLLQQESLNLPMSAHLVFTNPNFTLTGSIPNRDHILLPTELHKIPSLFKRPITKDFQTRDLLQSHSLGHYPLSQKPIKYTGVKPGIKCPGCKKVGHIYVGRRKKYVDCTFCHSRLRRADLYLYNINELYYLKGEPFTAKEAQSWLGEGDDTTIRVLLKKNYKFHKSRNTLYSL
ncbi:nuclease-related domain-containing protein [Staphylococcus massiliensis]|uniref:NERD domain-containing protein n=1 Tax=Staphylococcus massiliensis S46 TaxID=1229783 RepID=K9ARJ8_9STAP|nr:nuclease-related domain-containing protein [Staphylococcus massiliensis]EKU50068.1 NERD domain-containing protein [Staphylococcus massiliensis S46]MCG3402226.1 NERD domain-containing protein [Staphylococcus massiliensis]MCG3412807.1 NERD domain-containing protein [Staphylococcus massiliensis]PNZ99647.1 NERD domain-containing protein [Staphylococcus massiliensis CCUG 55927]